MTEQFRNLMAPMRIHHAVVVRWHGTDVRAYGRIEGFEGVAFDGIHPIVVVRTPGGSTIKAGRVWVKPADEIELASLYGYEFAAREAGRIPYDSTG